MQGRTIAAGAALLLFGATVFAADHVDSPRVIDDPATDLTDLYAWMSEDGTKVRLALGISAALFTNGVQYVFHVSSANAYGEPGVETPVICRFDADQNVTCWVGDADYVTGDAHVAAGITSESGRIRVFTGLRHDAFFFNASGFSKTIATVKAALSSTGAPELDGAGCPQLDPSTAAALAGGLATDAFGGPASDLFDGTVGMIVLEIDETLLDSGGPILGVWASVRR